MVLGIFGSIWDKLNEWAIEVKNFFLDNSHNPFLWIGIILIGLILFEVVYKSLHRD